MSETLNPGSFPSDQSITPAEPATHGLSDIARVVDTFVAPSRTFTDIRRSSRWWLPFVIGMFVTYFFMFAVQKQVGWSQIVDNQVKASPKMQESFANLDPTQLAERKQQIAAFTKYSFYGAPLFNLIFAAIGAAVLFATINFGFGGEATFSRMFAVWMYATLPLSVQALLSTGVLFAGVTPEQFQLQNSVGTNLGYYLPADTAKGLLTLATAFDVMTIWVLILLVIGCAIIGNIKRSSAAIAVVGWWVLIVLARTALAIVQS
jgi:hypothetical protein